MCLIPFDDACIAMRREKRYRPARSRGVRGPVVFLLHLIQRARRRARELALFNRKIAARDVVLIGLEKDMCLCLIVVCKINILYPGIAARAVIRRDDVGIAGASIAVLYIVDR